MPAVETSGISAGQPLHAHDEVGLGRLGDKMKLIAHETPGMELPAGFLACLAERVEEAAAVEVIAEDGFAAVTPVHQMIDGSGKLDAQRAEPIPESTRPNRHCKLLAPLYGPLQKPQ